jgi:hypothetical protein
MAAIAADACRRGFEFMWWVSRTWNTEAHAFFRRIATVEEPVVAFATFGDDLKRLSDDGERRASVDGVPRGPKSEETVRTGEPVIAGRRRRGKSPSTLVTPMNLRRF